MEKNKLQQLESMAECYTVDPKVAQNAVDMIERDKAILAEKKQKTKFTLKKLIPVFMSLILSVTIGVAVYFSTIPDIIYYDTASVDLVRTDDLDGDLQAENITVLHFDGAGTNALGKIKDTGKVGYVLQKFTMEDNFTANGAFDSLQFYAVAMIKTDFDFEKAFDSCSIEANVDNVYAQYATKELSTGIQIKAKFVYQQHEYFITIEAVGDADPVEKIDFYLGILLGE